MLGTLGKNHAQGRMSVLLAALVLACLFPAGCAPKRVINTRQEPPVSAPAPAATAPAPREQVTPEKQAPAENGPETTAENVTLGVRAAELAREQLGKPYQWGAAGPDRFDCSGLAFYVYGALGVPLPRVSSEQATAGREISRKRMQPGDLLFFALDGPRINHVGIYIGGRKFVHAPRRYQPVRTDDLDDAYWRYRLKAVRRMDSLP